MLTIEEFVKYRGRACAEGPRRLGLEIPVAAASAASLKDSDEMALHRARTLR